MEGDQGLGMMVKVGGACMRKRAMLGGCSLVAGMLASAKGRSKLEDVKQCRASILVGLGEGSEQDDLNFLHCFMLCGPDVEFTSKNQSDFG